MIGGGGCGINGGGLIDGSAFLIYQRFVNVFGRIIKNSVPVGDEFFIGKGQVSSVACLADDNVLATWGSKNGDDLYDIEGRLFNSTGTPLTNQFTIAPGVLLLSDSTSLANGKAIIEYQNATSQGSRNLLLNGRSVSFGTSVALTPSSWLTFPFIAIAGYLANSLRE